MSEIGKLFEATKPFRDEITKLHAKVERLKADNATLSLNSDGIWEKLKGIELENDDLRGEIVKVKTMCAEWENRTLNPSQVESIWGICHNALTMHKTNDTRKDPTDDERRATKEAQDRKFRPPDWTQSGRHG